MQQMNIFSKAKYYYLMNKDIAVLKFSYNETSLNPIKLLKVYKYYDLLNSEVLLNTWINNRSIPTNREHIENVLDSLGIPNYSPFKLLTINHACSLNDTLWIKEIEEKNIYDEVLTWKDVSLYRGFKESLGLISFFGNTSSLGGNIKTPEVTTQGVLGKAWRFVDSTVKLYKKGSSGACNTGNEPYSEVIAATILKWLDISHVDYSLEKWNGVLCSVCDLYTNESIGYISMYEYLNKKVGSTISWTYNIVYNEMKKLGLINQFEDMLMVDYLILNRDRHFKNFGLLIDNNSMNILGFMPLFDHGYSSGSFSLTEKDIVNDLNRMGTFNVSLRVQGLNFKNNKRMKHFTKVIRLSMNKLDNLDIPRERIEIAKKVLNITIGELDK